jgi:predicted PurR-regulated permease PerM
MKTIKIESHNTLIKFSIFIGLLTVSALILLPLLMADRNNTIEELNNNTIKNTNKQLTTTNKNQNKNNHTKKKKLKTQKLNSLRSIFTIKE